MIAPGRHRLMRDDELARHLGPEISAAYSVLQHAAFDEASMVDRGVTARGTRILVNQAVFEHDVVIGSRFLGGTHRVLYFWHYLGNRFLTTFSNVMTNLNLSDMECCYKVFRADVLRRLALRSERFGIEPELVARVAQLGCRIYEVPVSYFGRDYAHGKKITWRDGLAALWYIIRFRFFG